MRRLLLGTAALTAMSAAAFAADLPRRGPAVAPAPVYAAPIFTWSGFYVGLNAGGAWGSNRDRLRAYDLGGADAAQLAFIDDFNTLTALNDRGGNNGGFTGGVQAGYNWQFGSMVFGIEGDINYRGRSSSNNWVADNVGGYGYDVAVRSGRGSNWFGTIRPRLGVAFDRTLVYVTGGLAYGGGSGAATITLDNGVDPVTTYTSRRSGSNWGWTLGGGVEYAFNNALSLKAEYLYVDLDRGNNRALFVTGADVLPDVAFRGGAGNDKFHVVRAGLNWKFGGPAYTTGPVVAAY